MDNREKNIIDKFLDGYEKASTSNKSYQRVYVKPSKFKSLIYFIFSLLCFIILIRLFVFKVLYFVILIFNIAILTFYAINLFTKKGLGLPKNIAIENENEEDYVTSGDDKYKV